MLRFDTWKPEDDVEDAQGLAGNTISFEHFSYQRYRASKKPQQIAWFAA